jgi:MoaA/NifB/PqqE/SkfB family radical SAM enzyme
MGINQVSFLPADVSSHAFNRQTAWSEPKQHEILPGENELAELYNMVEAVIAGKDSIANNFIAEPPEKLRDIYRYYAAFYGLNAFPFKKCNAPWVSAVIEADGSVRPCFFHEATGNIRDFSLAEILNSEAAVNFRKTLDMGSNPTCVKCVCSLNLSPLARLN